MIRLLGIAIAILSQLIYGRFEFAGYGHSDLAQIFRDTERFVCDIKPTGDCAQNWFAKSAGAIEYVSDCDHKEDSDLFGYASGSDL